MFNILHIKIKYVFLNQTIGSGGNAINSASNNMRPNKTGQIVKFHTPFPDEDPNQLYVLIEIIEDVESPRALIKALNTGSNFPPTHSVLVDELIAVKIDTNDLIGFKATINKDDNSIALGKVVRVKEEKVMLDLNKREKGVETNVYLTIEDERGNEHSGFLYVN